MFIFSKKKFIVVSTLILVAFTFVICFGAISESSVGEASSTGIKVVIDAGHGGIDPGAVGALTKVKESEINLVLAKKLEKLFIDSGISVVLTRASSAGLYGVASTTLKRKDMEKRRQIIEDASPNLVISIHLNKFSVSTRKGAQVFYKKDDALSKDLALSIQNNFNDMQSQTKKFQPLTGDYFMLSCSKYPTVICECGYLSNPEEEKLLQTEDFQMELAYAMYKGSVGYLSTNSSYFEK